MKSKAHSKKCKEMGVPEGLIEDQDAEDSGTLLHCTEGNTEGSLCAPQLIKLNEQILCKFRGSFRVHRYKCNSDLIVIGLVYPICFGFQLQDCPFLNSSPVNGLRYKTQIVPTFALLLCRSVALPWSN